MKLILFAALAILAFIPLSSASCSCDQGAVWYEAENKCIWAQVNEDLTIENCKTVKEIQVTDNLNENWEGFEPNADLDIECLECNAGYQLYNSDTECRELPTNCTGIDWQGCTGCTNHTFLEGQGDSGNRMECKAVTQNITNCATYADADNCQLCDEGFWLQNTTTCTAVTAVTNCATFEVNLDECDTCEDGYHEHETLEECVENMQYCTINETTGNVGSFTTVCTLCGTNDDGVQTYYDEGADSPLCVVETSHGSRTDGAIDGCVKYTYNNGAIECTEYNGTTNYVSGGAQIPNDASFTACKRWYLLDNCYECQDEYTRLDAETDGDNECYAWPTEASKGFVENCASYELYDSVDDTLNVANAATWIWECNNCSALTYEVKNGYNVIAECNTCPDTTPEGDDEDDDDDDSASIANFSVAVLLLVLSLAC